MEDGKESGPHFSQVVAPVLAAFTLPTIALIVTLHPQPHLGNKIVALFVASTGLLLASFQFAVGRLFRDTPSWGAFRAFLAGLGLILLGAGLYLLVLSWNGETKQKAPYAGSREVLYAGLVVLAAGIVIPISINLWLYAERIFDALRRIRRGVAKRIRVLRWIYPPLDQERIEKLANERKREYCSLNPLAQDVDQEFSKEVEERVCRLKLIQAYPSASDVNYILKALCYSHSEFEKDQALRAAIKLIPKLANHDSTRLAAAAQLLILLND
jgi:hypothetical protein